MQLKLRMPPKVIELFNKTSLYLIAALLGGSVVWTGMMGSLSGGSSTKKSEYESDLLKTQDNAGSFEMLPESYADAAAIRAFSETTANGRGTSGTVDELKNSLKALEKKINTIGNRMKSMEGKPSKSGSKSSKIVVKLQQDIESLKKSNADFKKKWNAIRKNKLSDKSVMVEDVEGLEALASPIKFEGFTSAARVTVSANGSFDQSAHQKIDPEDENGSVKMTVDYNDPLLKSGGDLDFRADTTLIEDPYVLLAGSIIPADLITSINTDFSGAVVAQVRENIYDSKTGQHLLVPQGSRLIGSYGNDISFNQERLGISFDRMVRPDGVQVTFSGSKINASDVRGSAGVDGDVDNHWGSTIAGAVLAVVFNIGSYQVEEHTSSTVSTDSGSSLRQVSQTGEQLSQTIGTVGQEVTKRFFDKPPTFTVPQGTPFIVVVRQNISLPPLLKN